MQPENPALVPTVGGQIARIYLENFMTYDEVEITPGYHLNIIIGPNGTGKSSIVCAVLLGLGGNLKKLERGDRLSSYIKSGCDQSTVEIELYNPNGRNKTVKRVISITEKSQFLIDGKNASLTQVNDIRKEFNIQIDNLCTFLPQEKVQDFAKLNPQELLIQTERTVGHGDMLQQHEELKKLRTSIVTQERHNASIEETIEAEKQKNERLEDQIRVINEKRELHEQLDSMNQKKAWMIYREEVEKKNDIDRDTKLAQDNFNDKKKKTDEVTREIKRLEENFQSHNQKHVDAKRDEAGKRAAVEDRLKRAHHHIDNLEDFDNVIQSRIAAEETTRADMRVHETNVDKLTNDLRTLMADIGSEEDLRRQTEEISAKLSRCQREEVRLSHKKSEIEEDEEHLRQEARNATTERNLLERRNARMDHLRRHEPDVFTAVQWLEKNRGMFRGNVYNPILLELDIPDFRMTKFVENHINYRDLISFTCTNPEDLNLFVQKLRVEMKLRLNVVSCDEDDSSHYRPDVPIDDLEHFGFYGYMKDFVAGPEPILCYLCKIYRIHNVPIGGDNVKARCDEVPQRYTVFFSENHVFHVKVSIYSGDKSMTVKKIQETARWFTPSVDRNKIHELMEKEKDIAQSLEAKRAQANEIDEQLNQLRAKMQEYRNRKKRFSTKLDEKDLITRKLKRSQAEVDGIKRSVKEPAVIYAEAENERAGLRNKIEKSFENLKEALENLRKSSDNKRKCEIVYKASRFGIDDLLENKRKSVEEQNRAQETLILMIDKQKTQTNVCAKAKEDAKRKTNGISPGERGFNKFEKEFRKYPDTMDELDTAIDEATTRDEFLRGGSMQVLRDYEQRKVHIEEMVVSLEVSKRDLEKKKERLVELRAAWYNPVKALVDKINENFSRFFQNMGCAGEVLLQSGPNEDDYDQYGIRIRVKFRDNVPLEDLSRHFQSGGERAVSTAIYMLSLQELTSVPFRFVDEINQGMDPANERRIIDLIIRLTQPIESTQYFLITPKLLPKIDCSNTMTVLCIYNGHYALPSSKWDLNKFMSKKSKTVADENEMDED